ncbi:hypothetical protein, partial [Dubosiella newyorkensis]
MRGHCHERGEKKANKYPEEKEIDIIWDILRKKGLMFLQTVKLPSIVLYMLVQYSLSLRYRVEATKFYRS